MQSSDALETVLAELPEEVRVLFEAQQASLQPARRIVRSPTAVCSICRAAISAELVDWQEHLAWHRSLRLAVFLTTQALLEVDRRLETARDDA